MARTPAPDYEMFASIEKIDEEKRQVFGYASTEIKDRQGETVTKAAIEKALPAYMLWKNVREMHQPSAVGKAIEAEMHDKGLWFGAQVVDDRAWDKVKKGVYTGFSIGGKVTSRDDLDKSIITGLDLSEISLVDRPACPEAVFMLVKRAADGMKLEPVQKWDCGCPDHQHIAKAEASQCMAESQEALTKNEVVIGEDGLFKYMPPGAPTIPVVVEATDDDLLKYNDNHDGKGLFASSPGGSIADRDAAGVPHKAFGQSLSRPEHKEGPRVEHPMDGLPPNAHRGNTRSDAIMGYFDPAKGPLVPGSYREVRGGFKPGMRVVHDDGSQHTVHTTNGSHVTTTTGVELRPYDLRAVSKLTKIDYAHGQGGLFATSAGAVPTQPLPPGHIANNETGEVTVADHSLHSTGLTHPTGVAPGGMKIMLPGKSDAAGRHSAASPASHPFKAGTPAGHKSGHGAPVGMHKRAGGTMTPRAIGTSQFAGHGKSSEEAATLAKDHADLAAGFRTKQTKFTKLANESKQAGNMLGALAHSKLAASHGTLAASHEKLAGNLADLANQHLSWAPPTLTKSEELQVKAEAIRSRQLVAA